MSLSFLCKKSWHTGTLKNVEEVWKREEKELEEKRKVKELQKQIDDERKIQEMRELAGLIFHFNTNNYFNILHLIQGKAQQIKVTDNSLDWMYQGPKADDNMQNNDDYLLGKMYVPKNEEKSDIHKLQDSKKVGALWLNKVSSKNDTFSRINEDPLMMMKKTEIEARDRILNNPVKMAKIKHELQMKLGEDDIRKKEKKEAKKAKKALKKEKKEKKHKDKKRQKKDSSSSSSDNESVDKRNNTINNYGDRDDRNRRSRSRSRDRYYERRSDRDRSSRRSRSRSTSRGYYDRRNDRDYHRDTRDRHDDHYDNRRSNYRDDDAADRKPRTRSRSREGRSEDRDHVSTTQKSGSSGYGLVTGKVNNNSDKTYLGPQRELIEKKIEQEKRERDAKLNRTRENVTSLTKEEKQRRLLAMQNDADKIDEMRSQRFVESKARTDDDVNDGNTGNAKFLKEMRSNVLAGATIYNHLSFLQ